jgi:hypothetical protein
MAILVASTLGLGSANLTSSVCDQYSTATGLAATGGGVSARYASVCTSQEDRIGLATLISGSGNFDV